MHVVDQSDIGSGHFMPTLLSDGGIQVFANEKTCPPKNYNNTVLGNSNILVQPVGLQWPRTVEDLSNTSSIYYRGRTDAASSSTGDSSTTVTSKTRNDSVKSTMTEDECIDFPDKECRIVLLGKTGSGKSSTGNTILGIDKFGTSKGFRSTTVKCQRHSTQRFGVRLEVVDTPGLFDTHLDHVTITKEIARCLGVIAPGPHALLVVLRIGMRFTEEEAKAVAMVKDIFGEQIMRYVIIIFTHGDQLQDAESEPEAESKAMEKMLSSSPASLRSFVKEARNRYVIFNNNGSPEANANQVGQLLETIKFMVLNNEGQCYTSPLLTVVEDYMKERESQVFSQLNRGSAKRPSNETEQLHYRDIVREEVVETDCPLIQRISTAIQGVIPFLRNTLPVLLKLLWNAVIPMAATRCNIL